MKEYQTKIGKKLIDILMFSIYSDALLIYREYVQNSFDSIIEAVRSGLLKQTKDGIVRVDIDSNNSNVTITDNGTGITKSEAAKRLLNIADSQKDGENLAGQYGIGRLVGLKFCKKLIFKTSALGESEYSRVVFDAEEARRIIDDVNDTRDAIDVINSIAYVEYGKEVNDKHYFEVFLEGIYPEYSQLLDKDCVTEFLTDVAPIDFNLQFKNLIINNSIKDINDKNNYDSIPFVQLSINGNTDIRKRYGLKVEGTGDTIYSLDFFDLVDDKYGLLAWGWYAITPFTKAIPSSDKIRGIRLRKRNIQIGDETVLKDYFKEDRGNNYFYGEIHLVHKNIRPNTDRTALAPSPETEVFKRAFRNKCEELHKLYHLASEAKMALKDVEYGTRIVGSEDNEEEKNIAKVKISDGKKKVNKLKEKDSSNNAASQKLLQIYDSEINKIISNQDDNNSSIIGTIRRTNAAKPEKTIVDIFEPLDGVLSETEIKFIRKIFMIMSRNCPTSSKNMLEELKKKTINELSKNEKR